MRALAIVLALAAVGSFVVSFASRNQTPTGWTMDTPVTDRAGRDGITPIDRIDDPGLGVSTPDIEPASYSEYDHMRWNDARLWLGLAIGFVVSAVGVGVVLVRGRT